VSWRVFKPTPLTTVCQWLRTEPEHNQ